VFLRDLARFKQEKVVNLLAIVAMTCLVVSSIGPFTLAYIMSTHKGNGILYRNAIYTYLHFQYNGFFIMSVLALFFKKAMVSVSPSFRKRVYAFAIALSLSIVPSLFMTLLWRNNYPAVHILGLIGCILILLSIILFLSFIFNIRMSNINTDAIGRSLVLLAIISLGIKMALQTGTIFPTLRNAVFGYRPIIIGFLHLVFLGFISFYILSEYLDKGYFGKARKFSSYAIILFAIAIIINETILLADGIGLMLLSTHPIYPWLLWGAAILLVLGAISLLVARLMVRTQLS
jgi:hypothetical protein